MRHDTKHFSLDVVFTLSRTGTELGTGTGTRTMGDHRFHPLSWFRYNVKASTQFHATHLFPVLVLVPDSVTTLAGTEYWVLPSRGDRIIEVVLYNVVFQCEYSSYHVKKLQGILRSKLLNGEGLNVEKRLYIRLPKACVHKFHEIPDPCDPDSKVNISRLLRASMIKTEVRVQIYIWRLLRRP